MLLTSWLLLPVGIVLAVMAFAALVPKVSPVMDIADVVVGPIVGVAFGLIGSGCILLARKMRRVGKQHLSRITSVEEVLAGPPFVLYLRSFADDSRLADTRPHMKVGGASHFSDAIQGIRTEEEQLRVAVAPFGVMVAVGAPGEVLPEIGARRLYLPHDGWQDSVLRLMAEAGRTGLVVMGAGLSESLRWEFGLAVRTVPPQRLVLVIALSPQQYDEFRQGVGQVFPLSLPEYARVPTHPAYRARIRGAIYFDADWKPHFIRFDTRQIFGNYHRVIESKFVYGLWPVYFHLGVKWPGIRRQIPVYRRFTRRQIPTATFLYVLIVCLPVLLIALLWLVIKIISLGDR